MKYDTDRLRKELIGLTDVQRKAVYGALKQYGRNAFLMGVGAALLGVGAAVVVGAFVYSLNG